MLQPIATMEQRRALEMSAAETTPASQHAGLCARCAAPVDNKPRVPYVLRDAMCSKFGVHVQVNAHAYAVTWNELLECAQADFGDTHTILKIAEQPKAVNGLFTPSTIEDLTPSQMHHRIVASPDSVIVIYASKKPRAPAATDAAGARPPKAKRPKNDSSDATAATATTPAPAAAAAAPAAAPAPAKKRKPQQRSKTVVTDIDSGQEVLPTAV